MTWGATAAKAKFSEVLDRADAEGPQRVSRRKQCYVVVTQEEWDKRGSSEEVATEKPFLSVWDSLALPVADRVDWTVPRLGGKVRVLKF